MTGIEDIAKREVSRRFGKLFKEKLDELVYICINEAKNDVAENLSFKMIPTKDSQFRLEAIWADNNPNQHHE